MSGRDGRLSDSAAKLDQRILSSVVGTQERVSIEEFTWLTLVFDNLSFLAAHLGKNYGLLWERAIRPLHRRRQRWYGADTIEYISNYITYSYL